MIFVDLKDMDKGKYDIMLIVEEWSLKFNEIYDRINDIKMLKFFYFGVLFFCCNLMYMYKFFYCMVLKKIFVKYLF